MPVDPSRPPKPSWRDPIKPSDRRPEAQKAWRKEPVAAKASTRRWSKKTLFGISFIGLLVCAALIVKLVLMISLAKGACLVLIGAGYEENLAMPHNAYGMKGIHDLARLDKPPDPGAWSWFQSGDLRVRHGPQTPSSAKDWFKDWDSFHQKTVVIFLALHGGTDSHGPYLLLDDPTGQERLYLSQVLTDLAKLRDKNIVLILDPTQAVENVSLGMLHNDFVRQLREMEQQEIAKVPNLVIMLANGAGERSWVSDEWQQTIFAHYVIEGLRGGACKKEVGVITAQDLYDFVLKEVEKWVLDNRAAVQKPVLIQPTKKASAIELTNIKEAYTAPKADATEQAPGHGQGVRPELGTVWKEYQDLAAESLPPAVHSPHRWRQYGELVLRYEQLLRAGDPTGKAEAVRKQLDGLSGEMRQTANNLRTLPSMNNALPLAQTLGWSGEDVLPQFDKIWDANDIQAARWTQAKGAGDPVRAQFGQLLLEKAAEDPKNNLQAAHAAARQLYDRNRAYPAELHYLMLLDRDLITPRPDGELLMKALNLRRQSEQAALAAQQDGRGAFRPYSEYVYSWIRKDVGDGDRPRRLGQDWLISTRKPDWDKAKSLFTEAATHYQEAQQAAKAVREALTVRDQALAELPAFTRWLGRSEGAASTDLDTLEKLWAETHLLADALDPAVPGNDGPQWRVLLESRTEFVRKGLNDQRSNYQKECNEAETRTTLLPTNWRKLEELLSVPGLPAGPKGAEVRMTLLANSRSISDGLNIQSQQSPTTNPSPLPATPPQEHAKRQGRLALAALGETWVNRLAGEHQKSIQEFKPLHDKVVDPNTVWQARLNSAGEQIGDCWQLLPVKIREHVQAGRDGTAEKAQIELYQADRWAREISAAGAVQVLDNPPDEYRRLRLQGLLLWLADRTVAEHSWSDRQVDVPYYLVAGRTFLEDAKKVAVDVSANKFDDNQRKRRTETKLAGQVAEQLTAEIGFTVPKPTFVSWTDQTSEDLNFLLQAPERLAPGLPGIPMVRIIDEDHCLKLENGDQEGRTPVEGFVSGKPAEWPLKYKVSLKEGVTVPPKVKLEVRYRGQVLTADCPIRLQRTPDTIVHEYEEKNKGEFAARIDKKAYQASLVIILDGSGSMGYEGKTDPHAKCRYHRATKALRTILPTIPEGTLVTILAFGLENKKDPSAFLEKSPWQPENKEKINELMDDLDAQRPRHLSPIVNTMVEAQEKYLRDSKGLKTILVLTDGKDENASGATDPKITTNKLKDAFDRSGVTVNVVYFEIDPKEKEKADEQFQVIQGLKPRGYIYEVKARKDDKGNIDDEKTTKDLEDKIAWILRPKVRIFERGGPLVDMPDEGHWATFAREPAPNWFSRLRSQQQYTASPPDGATQEFILDNEDRLFVTIMKENDKLYLERVLYSDYVENELKRPLPARPTRTGEWQVAVMQNEWKTHEFNRAPFLQMMITAEDEKHRRVDPRDSLRLYKPRFMWLEVYNQADKEAKPARLNWGNLSGFPATAWTVEAPDWRPEAKPLVRFWVLSEIEPPSAASPTRKPNLELKDDFRQPISVGKKRPQEVIIESVQIEKRPSVEVQPGTKGVEECVVVRLRHAPDNPVKVELGGLNKKPRGAEHYFYNQASKYTAVFWGVSEDQLNSSKFFINVISLDEVKNAVKPVDVTLGTPDERPRP